jgi:hypothetical protein
MKLYPLLLVLLIALCVLAVASMLLPEPDGARGTDHPAFGNMKHGGSGEARIAETLWLNWVFGVLTLLVFVTLIAIGARKGGDLRGLGRRLGLTAVGCIIAWTCLVISYKQYMTTESHTLFLALPAPSAIMLYVLLPVTALLTAFYVIGFQRWILTEDDLAEYERLLADRKISADSSESTIAEDQG